MGCLSTLNTISGKVLRFICHTNERLWYKPFEGCSFVCNFITIIYVCVDIKVI